MHTRRDFLMLGIALGALGITSRAFAQTVATVETLEFDPDAFNELTTTVSTDAGDKVVVYRFYKAIPYVSRPVDLAYQSLNVSVPVTIDGVDVNASNAPILLANSVGGYMPSSVAEAGGVGGGGMTGLPAGGAMGGMPGDAPSEVASGGNAMMSQGKQVSNAEQALAAGYVVVESGARGRTLIDGDGVYYGVAPAAIVDLKAAVRYIRFNRGRMPGNTDMIVSSGTSAGGALSALLGASGDSPLFAPILAELGAAEASDAIFGAGCWCPIADLEHADIAYEWNWGTNPLSSGDLVDQKVSQELSSDFGPYQDALALTGRNGFGPVTAENYGQYLVDTYLQPSAQRYLGALSDADRAAYLEANPFLSWSDGMATFSWSDFLAHVGARKKSTPAFDAFDLSSGENNLFGRGTTQARHFTEFSLRHETGDASSMLEEDIPVLLDQMNPMFFLNAGNEGRARNWWLRVGAKDSDTSLTVVSNLALGLEKLGDDVNTAYYWDAGHGANEDAADFIKWIGDFSS